MPVISSNRLEIDATQAINTLNSIQSAFIGHNAAVGAVAAQYANFTASGRGATTTFTQINQAGQRVTTTVREVGGAYEILGTRISTASNAQRRMAADLERQRTLADTLARQIAGVGVAGAATPTTLPGSVNPALIAQNASAFRSLTTEQVAAAAAAHGLNAAQTAAFQNIVAQASRGQQAFQSLKERAESFRAKLGEFGQIAFATAIYRGLSLIQLGFTQGIRTASEYSRQVALVTTLSRESGDTFSVWSNEIRKVADEFGRPATEVAKAAYDGLSNQVIKTTRDVTLLEKSFALARSTGSEGGATLNVLSSVLNTYGDKAGSAAQISDELFKTVDLGRVRINELNGVIGRSASIAKTAGVSFQELEAGLIVLTQTGLDSAESATLLNNVFSQLIKPNDALAAQFRKMGFDTGTAAVQTLGFAGVMKKLEDAAKGTSDGIATFFPEIRGLRGAATFAGEGIDKFVVSLRALEKADGAVKQANDELAKSAGFKLGDEVSRIKNFFTVDLGQLAIEAVAKITGALGGMANITRILTGVIITLGTVIAAAFVTVKVVSFGTAIGQLTAAAATLLTQFSATTAGTWLFGQSLIVTQAALFGLLGIFALAIAAGAALGYGLRKISDANSERAAALAASFEKERAANKESVEKQAADRIKAFDKSVDEMTRLYGRFIAQAKQLNNDFLADTREKAKGISEALTNEFQVFLGIAKKGVNQAEQAQQKASDNIKEIAKDRIDLIDQYEQKAFERALDRLSEIRQAQQSASHNGQSAFDDRGSINDLVSDRNNVLRNKLKIAVDTGNLDTAKRLLTEIQGNLDKLQQFHFTGIDEASLTELNNFLNLEEQLKQKTVARTEELAKQVVQEKLQLKTLEDVLRKVAEFSTKGAFDKEGKLLPKFTTDSGAALRELSSLQQKAFDLAGALKGVGDPITLIQYNSALKEIEKTFGDQQANLKLLLQGSQRDIALTKAGEARIALANEEKKLYAELTKQLAEQRINIEANVTLARQLTAEIQRQSQGDKLGNQTAGGIIDAFSHITEGFDKKATDKIKDTTNEIQKLLTITDKDYPAIYAKIEALDKIIKTNAPNLKVVDPLDTKNVILYSEAIDRLRTSIGVIRGVSNYSNDIRSRLDEAKSNIQDLDNQTKTFIEQAFPGLTSIVEEEQRIIDVGANLDKTTAQFEALSGAIDAAANAAARLKAVGPIAPIVPKFGGGGGGGQVEGFAAGGQVGSQGGFLADFFGGKFARGTDTIPAMLSRNEFVVRAPMAERYYSQLVAMNAGHAPIYRAQGGPVSNTRVGDIHLTIQGGNGVHPQQLASAIRRGIKQGTMKIN